MTWTEKSSGWSRKRLDGPDPFQHWYRNNQVYFISARCRDRYPALASEQAKAVFWDRLGVHAATHQIEPWVTTLLDNHYHIIGYCTVGAEMRHFMRKLHGSVAKLVNDLLPERRVPFWRGDDGHDYFDGCLRDDEQYVKAYRYTLMQAVRARMVQEWQDYPHTRVFRPMEDGLAIAQQRRAFLYSVPYKRYTNRSEGQGT